ncbi:DUF4291 family protein [Saccharopolyspora shandongensis]|uniref:DUF4291 family protein n=1 Tax=Saccharopolyspora shandongensis TaxID=418495 RepID=UPI0033D0A881
MVTPRRALLGRATVQPGEVPPIDRCGRRLGHQILERTRRHAADHPSPPRAQPPNNQWPAGTSGCQSATHVAQRQIRGEFDARTIVVYQAYSPAVAEPALRANRFVPPFSFNRMTWIKPSFLWLMHRSGWAQKAGQERILAVRITRQGWEEALSRPC